MNGLASQSLSVHLSPLVEVEWIWGLGVACLIVLVLSALSTRRMPWMRGLTFGLFILFLLGPSLHEEKRERVASVVAVIVDESASQGFGERTLRTEAALAHIEETLGRNENVDVRVARGPADGALASRTDLFATLESVYADVPESRRAGVIFISDGQIHDVPLGEAVSDIYGPVHLLLSGEKREVDRRIVISNAPTFGIVGQDIDVQFRVEDAGVSGGGSARVSITMADGTQRFENVRVGEDQSITLPVSHAGQNVFEMSVEALANELTLRNNKVALDFQGVRDRLKVLLVSGKPHAGGRTWRDLLTGDPGVDLVHFTILREPEKADGTPQSEMSLIAFPFRELFELKLYDFDLIVFDRYRLNRILPDHYFQNIARYVKEGGAFLEASGPEYASEDSIFYTALNQILPSTPTGDVFEKTFVPEVSEVGVNHPVTRSLIWKGGDEQAWGAWERQIGLSGVKGDVLMRGASDRPLLILNRVDEGRVAQIASDHIWLWSRGFDGGGPHAELLRRTVHWLMKEPELDEEALDVRADGQNLIIRRAGFERDEDVVSMTLPDGTVEELVLERAESGVLEHLHVATQTRIYKFETRDGKVRFVVVGAVDPLEFRDVLSSDAALRPLIDASQGGAIWLSEHPTPSIRTRGGAPYAGRDWVGLKNNDAYVVTGAQEKPFLPLWLSLGLLLVMAVATWVYEGRRG